MFLLITHALALDPPLKGISSGGTCTKIPCNGITADPTAGIVPSDVVEAIGQGTRTDLAWTPLDITLGDGVFSGYLIAETTRSGDLDTTGGTWFWGAALLDADSTEDIVAGEVVYTPGAALTADLNVMFDQGTSRWAPTAVLRVDATYGAGGSAAAPVYGWTLGALELASVTGATMYSTSTQPVDIDLTVGNLAYRMSQNTRNSASVSVEEVLSIFADGALFSASAVGNVTRSSSTVSSHTTYTDGTDVDTTEESVAASARDFRGSSASFSLAGGVATQQTVSSKGGAHQSQLSYTSLDSSSGLSVRTASGGATTLTVTAFPTAGVSGSPFTSMMRTIADQ